jgi:DNA-binding IclR family transcriptional regulator
LHRRSYPGSGGKPIAAVSLTAFESYMPVSKLEETISSLRNIAQRISYMAGFQDGIA